MEFTFVSKKKTTPRRVNRISFEGNVIITFCYFYHSFTILQLFSADVGNTFVTLVLCLVGVCVLILLVVFICVTLAHEDQTDGVCDETPLIDDLEDAETGENRIIFNVMDTKCRRNNIY